MVDKIYNVINKRFFRGIHGFFVSMLIYRCLLDITYYEVINKIYLYSGFKDEHSMVSFLLSGILFLCYTFLLYHVYNFESRRFTSVVVFCWGLFSFIPFTTMISTGILSNRFIWLNVIFSGFIFAFYFMSRRIRVDTICMQVSSTLSTKNILYMMGILSILIVLWISYRYTGFNINFDLLSVYKLRMNAENFQMATILRYMFAWTKIINIIFIAYFMKKKNLIAVCCITAVQMLSFGIDGMKDTFFMTFLAIAILIIYKHEYHVLFKRLMTWGMSAIAGIGLLEYVFFQKYMIISLFVRRMMFVPIQIGNSYIDFFSKNQPDYFRLSVLRYFGVVSPYPGLSKMIGKIYYAAPEMSCNNGLVSDAIVNFGTAGVFLMPLLYFMIFWVIECVSNEENENAIIVLAVHYAMALTNSFLMTTLLTHGLIISIIMMSFWRSRKAKLIDIKNGYTK